MQQSASRRGRGFMALATAILNTKPGLTASQVASAALMEARTRGITVSASDDPQGSLISTLHKRHSQFGLVRRLVDGEYRFYPKDGGTTALPASSPGRATGDACCRNVSEEDSARIKALVQLGLYSDEDAASRSLVKLGLEALLAKLAS